MRTRASREHEQQPAVASGSVAPDADPAVEAVLGLQQAAGNQAVSRLVASPGRASGPAIQRTKDEAQTYAAEGAQWHSDVWIQGGDTAPLVAKLNGALNQYGIRFKRGFQRYDPVVVTGVPLTYQKIVDEAKGQADGGVSYAKQFRDWYSGETALAALPQSLRALALITHWAEVARGYKQALASLYVWIDEIAEARSREEARNLWGQFNDRYRPSLTYKDDVREEFSEDVEMEEARVEADEPYEEGGGMIPESEMANVRGNPVLGSRLRSGNQ